MNFSLSAFAPENLVSRDGFGSSAPRQPAHLQTLAESGAHSLHSSLNVVLTFGIPSIQYYLYVGQTTPAAAESCATGELLLCISFFDFSLLLHVVLLTDAVAVHDVLYCVCVFSSHPFWTSSSLDVPAGVTQEEGHTGFLIHLPSAVRALIFVARRIQPFLSLVDREVEFCVLTN